MGRNAQIRRFRRDLQKKLHSGPTGEPDPSGNRSTRRSKSGKAQMALTLEKLRTIGKESHETV